MDKPTLLVLAAGMGSRFGGLKQIEPLGPHGEIILDYSLYDARLAGFEKVVFVIKPEIQEVFEEKVGVHARKHMEVAYAMQTPQTLPSGCPAVEGRVKPWGTGHAVLCAKGQINGPFGTINADDFYGRDTYARLYGFLSASHTAGEMCMVGFPLENTLTENGTVSRGICRVEHGQLLAVDERTKISRKGDEIVYTDGEADVSLPPDSVASMNVWGLDYASFDLLERDFTAFYRSLSEEKKQTAEFYLPAFVDGRIKSGEGRVTVLTTASLWHGVTYREDKPQVAAALAKMHANGVYPPLK